MRLRLVLVLLAALLAANAALPANATLPRDTLKDQIKDVGEDLDNANAKVAKALKDYKKAASALPAARARLSRAQSNLKSATAADQKAATELMNVTTASNNAETKLEVTKTNLQSQQDEVTILIRSMYRQGPMSELAVVLGADTPEDFTARVVTVATWHNTKQAVINGLLKSREDLTIQTAELATLEAAKAEKKKDAEAKVLTAAQAAAEAQAAQKKVDKLVAKQAAALKVAQKNQAAVKARYDALKKKQSKLRAAAKKAADDGADLSGNNNLLWPVSGAGKPSGAGAAGWRIHPVYGYKSCHTGIDLGAPSGTSIKAAESGRVADAGYDNIYGNFTLITHGEGMTTFYAHQSAKLVKKGDSVSRGETIGKVGTTGWSTGPHLHFEVRINGVPWDPMGWFGSSKSKIGCAS